jgi:polyisoprenoid-binding protein YceI
MKHVKAAIALIALAFAASASAAATDLYSVDKIHSEAAFQIRHLMSKVSGRFDDFAGSINIDPKSPGASSVEFTIKAGSINTGVSDRDNHLRSADFFDVAKYPEITFKSTSIAPTGTKDLYDVTGILTMRGVSKKVTIPVAVLGFAKDPMGNERAGFELHTTLNRKEYGVSWNKALDAGGFLVGDDVSVTVNIEAAKAKPVAATATSGK